ncbi:hypothetical protein F4561_005267 [Lipingzhangella halophila]|uniref:Uncharacterized protein n=1 Tax=Lipingzhangella halophila TaxID=1783352 RepID=A0A7W7RME6_9ACTN|nr:hypothetical protein [Lipingzhangella halophila]MBB4934447.1 hypothetical protein [Lipingzhangella halophila]
MRAVGVDYARHLPGLFAVSYFDPVYTDLIGEDRFAALRAAGVRRLDYGRLVEVSPGPADRNSRTLHDLGPEHFFRKADLGAPDWGCEPLRALRSHRDSPTQAAAARPVPDALRCGDRRAGAAPQAGRPNRRR